MNEKVIYLTFDDGPDLNTPYILDLLKKYNIKATFFNLGIQEEKYPELVKRIIDDGHTLGNHSWSHDPEIYEDVTTFMDEVDRTNELQRRIIKKEPDKIFRFPFGSTKASKEIIKVLEDRGYNYIDWNVYLQDGSRNPSDKDAYNYALNGIELCDDIPVILTHCERPEKTGPLKALESIIKELKEQGYTFNCIKLEDQLVHLN